MADEAGDTAHCFKMPLANGGEFLRLMTALRGGEDLSGTDEER